MLRVIRCSWTMTVRMIAKHYTVDTTVGYKSHMNIISDMAAALMGSNRHRALE
jgi:hypothetical protein